MKARSTLRDISVALAAICVTSVLLVSYIAPKADADHEPANKVAASGSTLEMLEPDSTVPVLQERVKVSSPFDLILSLSSECSILTALRTGDDEANDAAAAATDTARAFSQLSMFITIDGRRVPITTMDSSPPGEGTQGDSGQVVFCNREYQRTVTESESEDDGLDTEEDFIRTRTANAFNWLALDVGFNYDDHCALNPEATNCYGPPATANGNNILDIVVWAEFERGGTVSCGGTVSPPEPSDGCADALVGRRTLIAEPTNASNHEWVQPTDPEGGN